MRACKPAPHSAEWFREQVAAASLEVARTALVMPGLYPEAQRLAGAKRALAQAQRELDAAQKDWDALVAPALVEAASAATPRRKARPS